jgi:hypothetical protein
MSRTSTRARSKSDWRKADGGRKGKPYGAKAVRNFKAKSNG